MNDTAPALPARLPDMAAQLPDFSDRLSPMLVKELRQGMRSPVFVWGMILMNAFLAVVVWLTMLEPESNGLHRSFFWAYCILVCGLLPLRAAGALHDELKGNTIDTLMMTRLTGWRITLGKWIAVVAMQCLAAVTVLPYEIVRYFMGGLNVPLELAWLGIFLLAGMTSAAVLTGFSWTRFFLVRAALMMGITFLMWRFCTEVLDEMFDGSRDYLLERFYVKWGWRGIGLLLVAGLHLAFFALDLGASQASPLIENRAPRRRVAGLMAVTCYVGIACSYPPLGFTGDFREFLLCCKLAGGTLLVVGLQALVEMPVNFVSTVTPWVKRGKWGVLAGRFFYNGWPSGVMFLGVLLAVCLTVLWRQYLFLEDQVSLLGGIPVYLNDYYDDGRLSHLIGGWGALIGLVPVPLVLWQIFFRKRLAWHLGVYGIMLMLVASVQLGLIAVAAGLKMPNLLKGGLPLPTMSWTWLEESYGGSDFYPGLTEFFNWGTLQIIVVSWIVILAWWLVAMILAMRAFQETRAVEREAAGVLKQDNAVEAGSRG